MSKKTIYYIVGGVAIVGIIYFLSNKKNKPTEEKKSTDNDTSEESSTAIAPVTAPAPAPATTPATTPANAPVSVTAPAPVKLTAEQLKLALQKCGKKPIRKKNKILYDKCRANITAKLKSQGLIAFDGLYSFEGVTDMYIKNKQRQKSFVEQVVNRENGRIFAGDVYQN